jgi:hypothetical protein
MAFEKGNKLGRGNKEAKLIEEALRRAIKQEDGKRIREGVEKLLDLFAAGDIQAFDRVADRLDGKPTQQVDMNVRQEVRDMTEDEILERLASLGSGVAASAAPDKKGQGKSTKLH